MSRAGDVIRWLEVRLNRPLLPTASDRAFWELYLSGGVPLEDAPAQLRSAAGTGTDLLVALTTYNRPESCARILAALPELVAKAGRPLNVHVMVVKDAGRAEYSEVERRAQALFGERLTWLDARSPIGKRGYWKTYQTLFLGARLLDPAHVLFLQDDLEFPDTLLRDCYACFDALAGDPHRRVLYLFASKDDEPEGRWIKFTRREVGAGVRLTQWFDLSGFFVDRALFELLDYRVFPVSESRWEKQAYSSGVGEQLTRRVFGRGNVYQTSPALVFHGAHPSEMNPEARAVRALDNRSPGG
ncbi:MAG TPA: hypothetical protein VLK88_00525 [Gemmatimonadales bacterium]|nr:hypothetical protein [Gemmatimonadales bacterium]